MLPDQFPSIGSECSRRIVSTREMVGELETTVPASHSALVAVGMAVADVPPTLLDAWEEDLESTVPAFSGASPGVPVRNRFSALESTVRDTDSLTMVGSRRDVEVFPMTDDEVGHVSREPTRIRPLQEVGLDPTDAGHATINSRSAVG